MCDQILEATKEVWKYFLGGHVRIPLLQLEAEEMLSQVIHWIRVDDSGLGMPKLEGAPPSEELGRPMILLNVLSEFCGREERLREKYAADLEWSVQAILRHVCMV